MESLAVKYRPKTFDDVTEQNITTTILDSICSSDNLAYRNFLLTGPAGTGKALTMDSLIHTDHGYVEMRDIKVGDMVYNARGELTPVVGIYPQRKQPIYKTTLPDETCIKTSLDHINRVHGKKEDGQRTGNIDITTEKLLEQYWARDFYVDCPILDWKYKQTPYDPYFYGCQYAIENEDAIKYQYYGVLINDKEQYLQNDYLSRLEFLRGLLSKSHRSDEGYILNTPSLTFSNDVAYLVRTLGGIDVVSSGFTHNIKLPIPLDIGLSLNPKSDDIKQLASRHPLDRLIKYITPYSDEMECQCIYVENDDHTYIVGDGLIPTHNTTCARIMADKLNNGTGQPIEIDAASHGGVDSIRELVDQAKQYPVGQNYKVFIVDECFSGDVKVLTERGYVKFIHLRKDDKVAQYHEDGTIDFVIPDKIVKKKNTGHLYTFEPLQNQPSGVIMTAKHVQPFYNVDNDTIAENYIEDIDFKESDRCILAGKGLGYNGALKEREKLGILCTLFASSCQYDAKLDKTDITFDITDDNRQLSDELNTLFSFLSIEYDIAEEERDMKPSDMKELGQKLKVEVYRFTYYGHISEKLETILKVDVGPIRGQQILDYIYQWIDEDKGLLADNLNFIHGLQSVSMQPVTMLAEETTIVDNKVISTSHQPAKSELVGFELVHDIDVYCVTVPTHMILVENLGTCFVSGNCHSISNTGWQSLLKVLEDGPAKTVWEFCTTNPEKIPRTILSRVQTFQLSKISLDGIYNRLKYVIDKEVESGQDIKYDEQSLYYIGKLANGGMRDALTLLDKVLSYSNEINLENISRSLNLPNYDDFFDMLSAYAKKDNKQIAALIDKIYNSGVNFVRWFEDFHSFVMNITKYIYLQDINMTMIPDTYNDKISTYNSNHVIICLRLANILIEMNQDLKTSPYLQETALTYLCTIPKKSK